MDATIDVNWNDLMSELEVQERATGTFFSFSVLDTVEILEERMKIKIGAKNKLISYCLEMALLIALEKPKTIKELKEELEFPEHLIYNKLKKMEKEGRIEVDRRGKLNLYATARSPDKWDRASKILSWKILNRKHQITNKSQIIISKFKVFVIEKRKKGKKWSLPFPPDSTHCNNG